IFIIEGEMGVGKTVFVKGIGEQLGINNIISPTFVILYEYDIKKSFDFAQDKQKSKMIHIDLYNIEDKQEFKYLGVENFLIPGNILCFEWGEKAGEIIKLLKSKGEIVYVKMKYVSEGEREIIIKT
ncbi:MAG: tRNA (adenosine(37)-N6)-threonylcarbamoyltransferase complex ATPase subunit type 1 TsaE, partial [Patescibacteria group bacterium]